MQGRDDTTPSAQSVAMTPRMVRLSSNTLPNHGHHGTAASCHKQTFCGAAEIGAIRSPRRRKRDELTGRLRNTSGVDGENGAAAKKMAGPLSA
jgi:hypothetical protein